MNTRQLENIISAFVAKYGFLDWSHELFRLIAPGEISKNFEIVTRNEKRESITILFEEKANLIPQGLKERMSYWVVY